MAVKVISGDNPRTVGAIARRLQLAGAEDPLDGRELPEEPAALAAVVESQSVFGRVAQRRSVRWSQR